MYFQLFYAEQYTPIRILLQHDKSSHQVAVLPLSTDLYSNNKQSIITCSRKRYNSYSATPLEIFCGQGIIFVCEKCVGPKCQISISVPKQMKIVSLCAYLLHEPSPQCNDGLQFPLWQVWLELYLMILQSRQGDWHYHLTQTKDNSANQL